MIALKEAWLALFDETFLGKPEGHSGTWFVEKSEALLPLLDGLNTDQASWRAGPGVSSVAAHARHTAYYLHLANRAFAGAPEKGDWEESWAVQEVGDSEWSDIRANLADEYRAFRARIAGIEFEQIDEDQLTYVLANLAHAAFHLGAIRQLVLLARH